MLQVTALALMGVALVRRAPRAEGLLAAIAIALVALTPVMHAQDTRGWSAFARPYVNDAVTT